MIACCFTSPTDRTQRESFDLADPKKGFQMPQSQCSTAAGVMPQQRRPTPTAASGLILDDEPGHIMCSCSPPGISQNDPITAVQRADPMVRLSSFATAADAVWAGTGDSGGGSRYSSMISALESDGSSASKAAIIPVTFGFNKSSIRTLFRRDSIPRTTSETMEPWAGSSVNSSSNAAGSSPTTVLTMDKSPATDILSQDLSCARVTEVDESEVAAGSSLPSDVVEASAQAAPVAMGGLLVSNQHCAADNDDKPRPTPRASLSLLTVQLSRKSAGSMARPQQPAHSQPLARFHPGLSAWDMPAGGGERISTAAPLEMVKAGPGHCNRERRPLAAGTQQDEHNDGEAHFDRVSHSYPA